MRMSLLFVSAAAFVWGCGPTRAASDNQVPEKLRQPEGPGLAAKYVRDRGIAKDPAVVFVEDFEEPTLKKLWSRWEDIKNKQKMSFQGERPSQTGGKQSLLSDGVSHLYRRIKPGHKQLYLRFYAKIDNGCSRIHHWVWLGGHNPTTAWPWPRAGKQPVGNENWSTGIEPLDRSWGWDFYTYWKDMRRDRDGNFWGNFFNRKAGARGYSSPHTVNKGEWMCIELMAKMNDPVTEYNGEHAFWINGKLMSHVGPGFPKGRWDHGGWAPDPTGEPFKGFQWRTDPKLDINYVWLEHFVDSDPTCKAWFDDLVVATKYIGPIATEKAKPVKKSAEKAAPAPADPLAAKASDLKAAAWHARTGDMDAARAAYAKVAGSLDEKSRRHVTVRMEGLAERKRLLDLIQKGVGSHGSKRVYIDVFGRPERAKIVKATTTEGTFRVKGSDLDLPWNRVSHRRIAGIAAQYAASAADHLAIAGYLAACGEADLSLKSVDLALANRPGDAQSRQASRIQQALRSTMTAGKNRP